MLIYYVMAVPCAGTSPGINSLNSVEGPGPSGGPGGGPGAIHRGPGVPQIALEGWEGLGL